MHSKRLFLTLLFVYVSCVSLSAQDKTIYLWKGVKGMTSQKSVMYCHNPKANNTGIAVIVCPGGSYHHLGLYNEGYCSSRFFAENGITAFTLKYRTNEEGYNHPAMLEDVQRAIQLVRENASSYGVDPEKIGVIGYSAGGHLVTMAGALGGEINELEKLGIQTSVSVRPDFCIPVYPVVSMQDDIAHKWSRNSLLGYGLTNQSQVYRNVLSMEMNIPDDMPPTYLVVCKDDDVVDYTNSLRLNKALQDAGCPSEFHLYEWGRHGFGMLNGPFMKEFHWNEPLLEWIHALYN